MLKAKCPNCKGKGTVITEKMNCPTCLGIGKTSFSLGSGDEGQPCEKCKGTGKVIFQSKCKTCDGSKFVFFCKQCNKMMKTQTSSGLCLTCQNKEDPVVYSLKPPVDSQLVRKEMHLLSRVESVKKMGVFVKVAPDTNVLIRSNDVTQDYAWDIGEEVIVKISFINDKGKFFGVPVHFKKFVIEPLRGRVRKLRVEDLKPNMMGSFIGITAKIVSIMQTPGPTRFNLIDPTGSISGAAFTKPGERAFPEFEEDMVVSVFGEINTHRDVIQIEIRDMDQLDSDESNILIDEIEKAIDKKATPKKIDFSIKSPILDKLRPGLTDAAKRIKRAILTGQPIHIRNHADADGTVAGFAVQLAIKKLMETEGYDPDTIRTRLKRLPNKPPFYDAIDVTKDLDFALADQVRFGDKLPLFVCLDFGSSTESLFPYLQIKALDLEIIVIDHHFPDKEIQELVDIHVNPYFVGGGYELSAGMLGVELARIIYPDIHEEIIHLPAIAGLMDRVEGKEIIEYIKLAEKKGYSVDDLRTIGLAIDFEVYQLRFSEGYNTMKILFGIETNQEWHSKMYNLIGNEAKKLLETSLKDSLPHCKKKVLANGTLLVTIDVELYTHRFTFPNPGKITGLIFDHFCSKNKDKAVVTLGEGPDFLILRSKGLNINFPEVVKLMRKEISEAGVEGGGHEVVGSLKFYEGERDKVKTFFVEHLTKLKTNIEKAE